MSAKDKLIQKQAHALKLLQVKLAEMEEDAGILADAVGELEEEKSGLAEEVAEKTEKLTEMATQEATSDSVDDEAKELLIDTIAKIDPELADSLADEIEAAEDTKEGLTAPKLASMVTSALNAYTTKANATESYGTIRPNRKTAGANHSNPLQAQAEAVLDRMITK